MSHVLTRLFGLAGGWPVRGRRCPVVARFWFIAARAAIGFSCGAVRALQTGRRQLPHALPWLGCRGVRICSRPNGLTRSLASVPASGVGRIRASILAIALVVAGNASGAGSDPARARALAPPSVDYAAAPSVARSSGEAVLTAPKHERASNLERLRSVLPPAAFEMFLSIQEAVSARSVDLLAEAMELNELPPDLGLPRVPLAFDALAVIEQAVETLRPVTALRGGNFGDALPDEDASAALENTVLDDYFERVEHLLATTPRRETSVGTVVFVWELAADVAADDTPGRAASDMSAAHARPDQLVISASGVWHRLVIPPRRRP